MTSFELNFDEPKVDTSLAEEYLQLNSEFLSSYTKIQNNPNNRISPANTTVANKSINYISLSQKIEENANLFSQLEYLLRKIPIEQVKNIDVILLIQNLIYHSSEENIGKLSFEEIHMTNDTPLAILGCITKTMSREIRIVSTKEMAAVCSLFVNLCQEVGLKEVHLQIATDIVKNSKSLNYHRDIEEFATGCVGIVTMKSDIDSAVDAFLYAPSKYPWQVKKIFVEECALKQFKNSIEWKTKNTSFNFDEKLLKSCTSVYQYDDKIYLLEYVGKLDIEQNYVVIEPYKTNKELITMMAKVRPLCISLWSSDTAQSNQLTYGINSNIIWINDFGIFDGPPITSQAFYNVIMNAHIKTKILQLKMKKEKWLNLDRTQRFIKLMKTFNNIEEKINIKLNPNSTISVGKKICIATKTAACKFVVVKKMEDIFSCLDFIVDGGVVTFTLSDANEELKRIINLLIDTNAPVVIGDNCPGSDIVNQAFYDVKAIWTSIGTTFAN